MVYLKWAFFAIWFASIATRTLILWKLFRIRVAPRYPVFCLFLLVSTIETIFRWYAGATGGASGYAAAWNATQRLNLFLVVSLVVECFVLHAKHFQRFVLAGTVIAGLFLTAAILLWLPTAGIGQIEKPDAPPLVSVTRHLCTIGYAAVLLTSAGFRIFGSAWIRPNVQEYARVLLWYFFLTGVGHFVRAGAKQGQWYGVVSAFITTGGALYCFLRWYWGFSIEGEKWEAPPPADPGALKDAETRQRRIETTMRFLVGR